MLSDYFLYSALGGGSSPYGGTFGALTYPLVSTTTTAASQAASQLGQLIEDETAKVAAFDTLLSAVTGFQDTLAGFDLSDETGATAAAQAFVDSYNELLGTVDELTGSGGTLEGDTTATFLVSSLQSELSATFGASGSFDQLYQIGITPQADGTLAFDSATFATAYGTDAAGAQSLLSETANSFDALVDPYAAGGGLIESSAGLSGDNLLDLQMALPALESLADQSQTYANAQYASAIYQLYGSALAENLFAAFTTDPSTSIFA